MLKVFSIFAVFLHKYAGNAKSKLYLVQTQAQSAAWGTEGEDFKTESGKPTKYSGHTETEPGKSTKISGPTGLYHIET